MQAFERACRDESPVISEIDVLFDGKTAEHTTVLEGAQQSPFRHVRRAQTGNRLVGKIDEPGIRLQKTGDQVDCG